MECCSAVSVVSVDSAYPLDRRENYESDQPSSLFVTSVTSNDFVVYTPYYRSINESECIFNANFTYDPYTLFALKTRLISFLSSLDSSFFVGGEEKMLDVTFPTRRKDDKLYITVTLTKGGNIYPMNEILARKLQEKVDHLTGNVLTHVLLLNTSKFYDERGELISKSWLTTIIPYLEVSDELEPINDEEGLKVNLSLYDDYMTLFKALNDNIRERILTMFKQGHIVASTSIMVERWNMTLIDSNLYAIQWKEPYLEITYGSLTNFLRMQFLEETYISLKVDFNWVIKHDLSKKLTNFDFYFSGNLLKIKVTNLEQLRIIIAKIKTAKENSEGKAAIFLLKKVTEVAKYEEVAKSLELNDIIVYRTDDIHKPITFSVKIDPSSDLREILSSFNLKYFER